MKYELTESGLVTSDPKIAVMFWGEEVGFGDELESDWVIDQRGFVSYFTSSTHSVEKHRKEITIPRPLIKAMLDPVEGEAIAWAPLGELEEAGIHILTTVEPRKYNTIKELMPCANWRVINIVRMCGELRALLEWAGSES